MSALEANIKIYDKFIRESLVWIKSHFVRCKNQRSVQWYNKPWLCSSSIMRVLSGGADPEHRDMHGPACKVHTTSCFERTVSRERSLPCGLYAVGVTRDAGRSHVQLHIRCVKIRWGRKQQRWSEHPTTTALTAALGKPVQTKGVGWACLKCKCMIIAGHLYLFLFHSSVLGPLPPCTPYFSNIVSLPLLLSLSLSLEQRPPPTPHPETFCQWLIFSQCHF